MKGGCGRRSREERSCCLDGEAPRFAGRSYNFGLYEEVFCLTRGNNEGKDLKTQNCGLMTFEVSCRLDIRAPRIHRGFSPVWSDASSLILGSCSLPAPCSLFHGGFVWCVLGEMFVPLNS
ncbi:hypothetical protein AMECASPLE_030821 [Ameca splendens]|uniref:Uncharacterized protein n=1 Tax=Ameca splendens TaxID=208324 RepID=A0ABV0YTE0_9TELE